MINKVIIQGRLGKDAEILKTKDGKSYSRFRIANSRSWRGQDGEWRDHTTWTPVITFQDGLVDKVLKEKAVKGAHVLIEGEVTGFDFKDKNGIRRVGIEVAIGRNGNIQFLPSAVGSKASGEDGSADVGEPPEAEAPPAENHPAAADHLRAEGAAV